MTLLISPIEEAQTEAADSITNGGRGIKKMWKWLILPVPADKLAYILIRSILTVRMQKHTLGRKASTITLDIGQAVKNQTEYEVWAAMSKDKAEQEGGVDVAKLLLSRAKNMNARQWDNWRRRIDDIERLDWQREWKIHIGSKLLEIAVTHGGGFFELKYQFYRNKTTRMVYLSDLCRKMIDDINTDLEINTPVLRPMLSRPDLWTWSKDKRKYVGGYYEIDIDFIRGGSHHHTADLDNPLSQETLSAADGVGAVYWKINDAALDMLIEARQLSRSLFKGIPAPAPLPLPHKTDEEWEEMRKEAVEAYAESKVDADKSIAELNALG